MITRVLISLSIVFINVSFISAQENGTADTIVPDSTESTIVENTDTVTDDAGLQEDVKQVVSEETPPQSFHQILKTKFIEGGAGFMGIVLLTLILGLALCIERILYLHAASSTSNEKLLNEVSAALKKGGVEKAKEVCRNTRGPIASIFYQGLERSDKGIDAVEKSIISYGSVQMGLLERGTTWILSLIHI